MKKRYWSLSVTIVMAIIFLISGTWVTYELLTWDDRPHRFWHWNELMREPELRTQTLINMMNDTTRQGDLGNYLRYSPINGRPRRTRKVKLKADGSLTGFDELFKAHAVDVGWDWRMLAAVACIESNFKPDLTSKKGASGLMQLMPQTAEVYGCPLDSIFVPDKNIQTAALLLERLEYRLRNHIIRVKNPSLGSPLEADSAQIADASQDLLYYTLASYNCGIGHVYDAIALANELGYDPAIWWLNVETCMKLKNDSAYYNRPCVKLGKFNAKVTLNYVQDVVDTYNAFCKISK